MKRTVTVMLAAALSAACTDGPLPTASPGESSLSKSAHGVWTVTSLDDPGDGSCTKSSCTLRAALAAAEHGDRIVFKSNLTGTIALTAGELFVLRSLTIEGPGADRLSIDGRGVSRVFFVGGAAGAVGISGLTITGGNAGGEAGGGIVVVNGDRSLEVRDSRVVGNAAGAWGGGIANYASATIVNSTVAGNSAAHVPLGGGGIFNYSAGTLVVVGSTISGNEAIGRGGAIYNEGVATISRTTISGNTASAGGIYNTNVLSVRSSTITKNTSSTTFAGGIVSSPGTTTITNTIVAGNSGQFNPEWNCEASVTSLGYNLTAAASGCPSNGPGDVTVFAAQVFTHVLEATLSANGGPTATHALIERGQAVDAGYCPGETTDQRGLARPYDDPSMPNALDGCDVGALEWRPAASTGPGKGPKK